VVVGVLQMKACTLHRFLGRLSVKITYPMPLRVAPLQPYGHLVTSLPSWACASALPGPNCLE